MYVHITDQNGEIRGQADHLLGEQGIWTNDGIYFYDIVQLPEDAVQLADVQIRIGLWFPDTRTYYWITDPAQADSAERLQLGTVSDLLRPR
jgi:hypothetical protein